MSLKSKSKSAKKSKSLSLVTIIDCYRNNPCSYSMRHLKLQSCSETEPKRQYSIDE